MSSENAKYQLAIDEFSFFRNFFLLFLKMKVKLVYLPRHFLKSFLEVNSSASNRDRDRDRDKDRETETETERQRQRKSEK